MRAFDRKKLSALETWKVVCLNFSSDKFGFLFYIVKIVPLVTIPQHFSARILRLAY
ncbi:protein of unknown function [Vibrio tapetis subsp. tapetis]|uniref:Uncharacterized protein n=1 Tax=Vibrio tapetis subsp. tapetis TaxID=1671868 RepID=A0A2N8ZC89_9VIBR|nr:protein of unknown function [Vibrio tapetis subsp. tapetis]